MSKEPRDEKGLLPTRWYRPRPGHRLPTAIDKWRRAIDDALRFRPRSVFVFLSQFSVMIGLFASCVHDLKMSVVWQADVFNRVSWVLSASRGTTGRIDITVSPQNAVFYDFWTTGLVERLVASGDVCGQSISDIFRTVSSLDKSK